MPHISKTARYSIGNKIDSLFGEILESIFRATYLPKKEKFPFLDKAIISLDVLKFFLQIAWEIKAIDNKKYVIISEPLNNIGKMLGGWKNQVAKN